MYSIVIHTPQVKDSYIANKDSATVGFLNSLMGKRISTGEKSDVTEFDK